MSDGIFDPASAVRVLFCLPEIMACSPVTSDYTDVGRRFGVLREDVRQISPHGRVSDEAARRLHAHVVDLARSVSHVDHPSFTADHWRHLEVPAFTTTIRGHRMRIDNNKRFERMKIAGILHIMVISESFFTTDRNRLDEILQQYNVGEFAMTPDKTIRAQLFEGLMAAASLDRRCAAAGS